MPSVTGKVIDGKNLTFYISIHEFVEPVHADIFAKATLRVDRPVPRDLLCERVLQYSTNTCNENLIYE